MTKRRPLIGLTGRRKKFAELSDTPDALGGVDLDVYFSDYSRAVFAAGAIAVHIPFELVAADVVDQLDGLLLSGGADIDPARYGHASETDLFPPELQRDEAEFTLLDHAVERGLPVFGICRGIQLVNVHGGGTLHQHVAPHARYDKLPTFESHGVVFESASLLGDLYGASRSVNSLHHQTVDEVASDYRVTARADDGGVEGIEHRELPIVAVQWHPEMMESRNSDPVFGWLAEAATKYGARR